MPKTKPDPGSRPGRDLHSEITAKIVAAIEAGTEDWQMPWHRPGTAFAIPKNALTGNAYQGGNILSLWIDADAKKFPTQTWATFKQYQQLGGQVRKGEKGSLIVKWGSWTPKAGIVGKPAAAARQGNDDANPERRFARPAWVFNAAQVDGWSEPGSAPRPDLTVRLAHVDRFCHATGAEFREGGTRAFYRRPSSDGAGDYIQLPPRSAFTGTATSSPTEAFESTRLHELAHWSSAPKRLDRTLGKRFGDDQYAAEELVAELAASFLCAELGISNTPRADHAQYLSHWLRVLKADSRAIFSAASAATKACDYLKSLQPAAACRSGDGDADESDDD